MKRVFNNSTKTNQAAQRAHRSEGGSGQYAKLFVI